MFISNNNHKEKNIIIIIRKMNINYMMIKKLTFLNPDCFVQVKSPYCTKAMTPETIKEIPYIDPRYSAGNLQHIEISE